MAGALLTQQALARKLGKAPETIRRWTRSGMLPTFVDPESGRVMYPEPAVDEWLASHRADRRVAS